MAALAVVIAAGTRVSKGKLLCVFLRFVESSISAGGASFSQRSQLCNIQSIRFSHSSPYKRFWPNSQRRPQIPEFKITLYISGIMPLPRGTNKHMFVVRPEAVKTMGARTCFFVRYLVSLGYPWFPCGFSWKSYLVRKCVSFGPRHFLGGTYILVSRQSACLLVPRGTARRRQHRAGGQSIRR